ncbi:unnamed protein product [Calicophoron daubneyi]|uniref:Uncharacterized protein n=1 Tax=Calicophoron daubneyi TaxID=300641 RepID=A0AAV2TTT1_CALDB
MARYAELHTSLPVTVLRYRVSSLFVSQLARFACHPIVRRPGCMCPGELPPLSTLAWFFCISFSFSLYPSIYLPLGFELLFSVYFLCPYIFPESFPCSYGLDLSVGQTFLGIVFCSFSDLFIAHVRLLTIASFEPTVNS